MWRIREAGDAVDVTIYPEEGNFPRIARMLLDLADHPSQVRYVSHPKAGFEVPEDLYLRFETVMEPAQDSVQEATPKRRGRPRKDANADKEE